jgi:ribosomal-protein-alanine N-acetyltransferase
MSSAPLVITTERLILTLPPPEFAPQVVEYFRFNRDHHERWNPEYPPEVFTESYWRARLLMHRHELAEGVSLRLILLGKDSLEGRVIGHCNFTNFERAAFQGCRLGYGLDRRYEGKGLMSEALNGAIGHVFANMGIHRIAANYLPTNQRSAAVLRRLGFAIEGYARDYLMIGGAWRDHVLTALANPNWGQAQNSR